MTEKFSSHSSNQIPFTAYNLFMIVLSFQVSFEVLHPWTYTCIVCFDPEMWGEIPFRHPSPPSFSCPEDSGMVLDVPGKKDICSQIEQRPFGIFSMVNLNIAYNFYRVPDDFLTNHKIILSI